MSKIFWYDFYCSNVVANPNCNGKYCERWSWGARRRVIAANKITWRNTKKGAKYEATWREPTASCESAIVAGIGCNFDTTSYVWNVNIPNINYFWDDVVNVKISPSGDACSYTSIFSRDNILYTTTSSKVLLLSSDYDSTRIPGGGLEFFDAKRLNFANIQSISLDSDGKMFVLDKGLSKVGCLTFQDFRWDLFTDWGGLGGRRAQTRFNQPNDIIIDKDDNVWVTDTGNACIKKYSNTGAWQKTIIDDTRTGYSNPPLSIAIDVNSNIHVLTNKDVYAYTSTGDYLFSYSFNKYTNLLPKKIVTNFNKQMLYVVFDNTVLKFFKNGTYAGAAVKDVPGLSGISDVYHDEFRNLLIAFGDKIYKTVDLMKLNSNKGDLPELYWSKQDMFIDKEEYVQNWVYNKSLQRLWDNIEMMRNTIFYGEGNCKAYTLPTYSKDKILIGQNEIVTSTVVNRVINYLWTNYSSLIKNFDPDCKN